jgi:hypothetical protein
MIVVYNKNNGNILYTVEGTNNFSKKKLSRDENYIVSKKKVKAHTHRIDIKNKKIVKKGKDEREKELMKRKELANKFKNKIADNKAKKEKELEDKIAKLERRLSKLEE